MTALEEKLKGSYLRISPTGVDYTGFDHERFLANFGSYFFGGKDDLAILIEDETGKHTELYAVFRPFNRRAAYTLPVETPTPLLDESIHFTPSLMQHLETCFHMLHSIDPQEERTETRTWQGKYRTVEVTQKMPGKNWWRAMFIDLYSNSEELHKGLFKSMDESSKEALKESDIWKRYELVRRYIRTMQEEQPDFKEQVTERGIRGFLLRHGSYMKPYLFRNQRDYTYFLLGLKHTKQDLNLTTKAATRVLKDQRDLEAAIQAFERTRTNSCIPFPHIAHYQRHKIFAEDLTKEDLENAEALVEQNGESMRSPIGVSPEVACLGFLALERRRWRKKQPTKHSYALLRISPEKQMPLPLKGGHVGLEEEDFSPRKEPSWDAGYDPSDVEF